MTPLLYLYGSAVGILGGFVVSIVMLHGSPLGFLHQIHDNVVISQLVLGLLKSVSFGLLIAIVGCRTGLRAGRSAAGARGEALAVPADRTGEPGRCGVSAPSAHG